jgi:hypothetical protein
LFKEDASAGCGGEADGILSLPLDGQQNPIGRRQQVCHVFCFSAEICYIEGLGNPSRIFFEKSGSPRQRVLSD